MRPGVFTFLIVMVARSPGAIAAPAGGEAAVTESLVTVPDVPPEIDLDAVPARFSLPTPWRARPLAVEGHASLGGPLGLLGAAVDVSTSDELSTGLGFGIGESTRALQMAAMLRVRLLLTRTFATGAEGSLGIGDYSDEIECHRPGCPPTFSWKPAFWSSLGLFLESRSDAGWTMRAGFGASAIMNVADARCKRCGPADEPNMWVTTVPYAGVAIGRAFSW
jgi:hypothetical protein